jgi:hypothetical protein
VAEQDDKLRRYRSRFDEILARKKPSGVERSLPISDEGGRRVDALGDQSSFQPEVPRGTLGTIMKGLRWPQQKFVLGPALAIQESIQEDTPLTLGSLWRGGREAVREDLSFKEMATRGGLEGKTAAAVGLAGDVLLDPLLLLSPIKAIKSIGTAARLPQASRALGVTKALKALKETAPAQALGRAFVQDFGKSKAYKDLRRNLVKAEDETARAALSLGKGIRELGPESELLVREFMEASPVFQRARPAGLDPSSPFLHRYKRKTPLSAEQFDDLRSSIIARAPQKQRESLRQLSELSEKKFREVGEKLVGVGLLKKETLKGGGYSPTHWKAIEAGKAPVGKPRPRGGGGYRTPLKIGDTGFRKQKVFVSEKRAKELGGQMRPGYSVTKQLAAENKAALRGKFFKEISEGEWALPLDDVAAGRTQGYKALPKKESLGALSGRYVLDAVHHELTTMGTTVPTAWQKGLGMWKYGKVVLNPASHGRNISSNFILADLAGLAPWKIHRYRDAWRSLSKKDEFYELAQKHGTHLTNTFVDEEMSLGLKNAEDLSQLSDGIASTFSRLKDKTMALLKKPGRAYQKEEQWFKQAFFIDHMKKAIRKGGKPLGALSESAKETLSKAASDAAQDALFDYRNLPVAIDKMRRWGVVPFIAFPYKAITATGRAVANRPAALGRYGHLEQAFEPSKEEQVSERTALPEYMQKSWMRLPEGIPFLKDEKGHARYLNLQYILPWSDLGEVADDIQEGNVLGGYLGTGGPQSSFLNIPAANLVSSIVTGVNPFTTRNIEDEPGGFRQYFTDFILPPLLGRGEREIRASIAGEPVDPLNRYGETKQVAETVASNIFGFRTRPVDITKSRYLGVRRLAREAGEVRSKIKNIQLSRLSRSEKESAIKVQLDEIREIMGELRTILYGR